MRIGTKVRRSESYRGREEPYMSRAGIKMLRVVVTVCLFSFSVQAIGNFPNFTKLVDEIKPSVVNIRATRDANRGKKESGYDDQDIPDALKRFLREPYRRSPRPSAGSGFIIDKQGYILTNNHVVDGADEIIVALSDRRERVAEVVGYDPLSDLALLKISESNLPAAKLAKSLDLRAGSWVIAIGSPFGFQQSVTAGIISATGRSLPEGNGRYVPFIQTDVAINPGNSGGPLIDLNGNVVGINSQIFTRSGGFMGLSFAIPIDVAMEVVEQLKENGEVVRGWLGVGIQKVDMDLAKSFGLDRPSGALVTEVFPGSAAEQAGVLAGDIISSFNGKKVDLSDDLPQLVGRVKPSTTTQLVVVRDGKKKTLAVTIGALEEERLANRANIPPSKRNRLGLVVEDIEPGSPQYEKGLEGVLVSKVFSGAAQEKGIKSGDVIRAANNRRITSRAQFEKLIADLPENQKINMLVVRENRSRYITIDVP